MHVGPMGGHISARMGPHGHVSATTRIKSNIQIGADVFQKKRKNEKKRGPFCNCAAPKFFFAIFIKKNCYALMTTVMYNLFFNKYKHNL